MTSRVQDLAWAAGFFDGEGCFSVGTGNLKRSGTRSHFVCLTINQVDREVLDKFHSIMGVGSVRGPIARNDSPIGTKPLYIYKTTGKNASLVAKLMWSQLGNKKRQQYKRCLALCSK